MQSHEIDYKIVGNDIQLVEVELDPGETVIAEAGAMLYMEETALVSIRKWEMVQTLAPDSSTKYFLLAHVY